MNSSIPNEQPLGLYALATRWKWVEEARFAASATLSSNLMKPENFRLMRMIDSSSLVDLLELHAKRKEMILRFFDLRYREHKNFVVYQWECGCSTDEDGTTTETFVRQWNAMRYAVGASLEKCPLGSELKDSAFWSERELKLWSFCCRNCNKLILNKQYFVKRVGDLLASIDLPMTV